MSNESRGFFNTFDKSAVLTALGVIGLFLSAIVVTLVAPAYIDKSWTSHTSAYQKQMYEVADPNIYLSSKASGTGELQMVYHLKDGYNLLAFRETELFRIIAPPHLEKYITRPSDEKIKLTSDLLFLRTPISVTETGAWNPSTVSDKLREELQKTWETNNPNWQARGLAKPRFSIMELCKPPRTEAFVKTDTDGIVENWVDKAHYEIIDPDTPRQPYHSDEGVLFVLNPEEYRLRFQKVGSSNGYLFDTTGDPITSVEQLKAYNLAFSSRKELIALGEHLFSIEGCWYCHTDQTRTLVQDTVLNGSDSFPAPPSSANEYIYQQITFPGTRRIGPDLSRVGVKRPSRDWHLSHFWSPKTASRGTIMPAFRHFFDDNPSGSARSTYGVPNYQFEAIFQYLMTKGTRITPPTKAWWNGKDPIPTIEIIEGRSAQIQRGASS